MSDLINTVILAAGKGTRLKIETPKPLCPALGKKLVDYVIEGVCSFTNTAKIKSTYNLVVGHSKEEVQSHVVDKFSHLDLNFAYQEKQLGTGHALKVFFQKYPTAWNQEYTLVVCADTPLITNEIYYKLFQEINESGSDAVCATFKIKDPTGYGRIENAKVGFNIIEEKDASSEQKLINEVNSGLYIFKTSHIKNHIEGIDDQNKSGEFYLTDLFKTDLNVGTCLFESDKAFIGVNNLIQLEEVETALQTKKLNKLMLSGVRIISSKNTYIEDTVTIGSESVIYPGASLSLNSKIGQNCIIENGAIIKNSIIGDNVTIKAYSYLEGAKVDNNSAIGPMARLREGTQISEECKIGNFVETKKSILAKGVKVSHLSYVGDAEIGENTNIGCGFITCNYDGANKHKTIIGKDSFIGSDCQMVAPVNIGDECFVASGSTINEDVPNGAFAIARQRQVTKEEMAKKFIKKK